VASGASSGGAGFLSGGFAQRKFEHQSKNTANWNFASEKVLPRGASRGEERIPFEPFLKYTAANRVSKERGASKLLYKYYMAYLVLVRHSFSEYNQLGLWTGQTDVELSPNGVTQARQIGEALRGIPIHKAHTSLLRRAKQTLHHIQTQEHQALNERHYGIYTGKNKWQIQDELGQEEFLRIRRGWDHAIPQGETLKDVYQRVVPYYESVIALDLAAELNTLVVAHGNSLRALIKYLEQVADHEITQLEIGHDEAHCYTFDAKQRLISKEIRRAV